MAIPIGIVSFLLSLFASSGGSATSAIRVYAALNGVNGNPPTGADGTVGHIQLYDKNQQLLGNGGGTGHIKSGEFKDVVIPQLSGKQAYYAQVFADTDAICIPAMTITWFDSNKYAWVGDWGWHCGLQWYYGNVVSREAD